MGKRKAKAESPEDNDYEYDAKPAASTSRKGKGKQVKTEYDDEEDVKPTKSRAKKAKTEPEGEKRLARFRAKMPKNIQERLERVMQQRFFCVNRERNGTDLAETFKVLGSTGNVYDIQISHVPSCLCPDGKKGNHCKHILFVFTRVLGQPVSSPHIYQKALLTSELEEVFSKAASHSSNHTHNPQIVKAWEKATVSPSKREATADEEPSGKRRLPAEDDNCPICYEEIFNEDPANFLFCSTGCGGPIHKECFAEWSMNCKAKGQGITCVYCREKWPGTDGAAKADPNAPATYQDGYLNLAAAAGISTARDTSTYYHGPRAGVSERRAFYEAEARYEGRDYGDEDYENDYRRMYRFDRGYDRGYDL